MEADGDPATFTMNVKVLKAEDGTMFKLVKYTMQDASSGNVTLNKGAASVMSEFDLGDDDYVSGASRVTTSSSGN